MQTEQATGKRTLLQRLESTLAENNLTLDDVEWVGTNDATVNWERFVASASAGIAMLGVRVHGKGWVVLPPHPAAGPAHVEWQFVSTVRPFDGMGD